VSCWFAGKGKGKGKRKKGGKASASSKKRQKTSLAAAAAAGAAAAAAAATAHSAAGSLAEKQKVSSACCAVLDKRKSFRFCWLCSRPYWTCRWCLRILHALHD